MDLNHNMPNYLRYRIQKSHYWGHLLFHILCRKKEVHQSNSIE